MMSTTKTIPERVRDGVDFLDEAYGFGWPKEVDDAQLDLADPCNCVLGQLVKPLEAAFSCSLDFYSVAQDESSKAGWRMGQSEDVAQKLGFDHVLSYAEAANLGFHLPPSSDDEWHALTREWKRVIAERRALAEQ